MTSDNKKPSETVSGSAERQLFFRALEKPAGKERAAFLDVACGDDPDLRRRLEALLQKFETLDTFLEEPAVSAPDSLHRLITVKLIGTVSNRSAIGAKVHAKATIGGVSRWQLRQITGGSGFAGHNELQANFGLGDSTNVELVRIEWPSGIAQTLTNVAPKQFLTVVEHQPGVTNAPNFTSVARATNGAVNLSVAGDAGLLYLFEASTNLVNWSWLGVRTNAAGTIQFTDFRATNYANGFYRVSIP